MSKIYFVGNRMFTVEFNKEAGLYSVDYGASDQMTYRGPENAHRLVLEAAIKRLCDEGVFEEYMATFNWRSYQEVGTEVH